MKRPRLVFRSILVCAIVIAAGCAQQPKQLYMWGSFPRQQYDVLLRDGASPLEQIKLLETHTEKARSIGAALPPGLRAHLGMLKLSVGDSEQARQLWKAEKEAFPESAPYMDQLLNRLNGQKTSEKTGNST